MTFAYTYRTPDGERHADKVSAESRDAAFAMLRVKGIRPIRMTRDGDAMPSEAALGGKVVRIAVLALASAVLVIACAVVLLWRMRSTASPIRTETVPRPRHFLEARIPVEAIFKDPTERYLAVFAEPGREVRIRTEDFYEGAFAGAVARPIVILPSDSPPVAELKRIVAGLKEEAAMQLKGGKGAKDVATWFADRQQMEIEWRKRLAERISSGEVSSATANRMLSSMGFEPL